MPTQLEIHPESAETERDDPEKNSVETHSFTEAGVETRTLGGTPDNLDDTDPLGDVSIFERMRQAKPLGPGDFLGSGQNYRIVKRLGRGGMGETFLAEEMESGEIVWEVVCKIVPPEIQNLEKEILAVRHTFSQVHKLNHTNICPIRGLKFDESYGWFLVMGYANGGSLSQYLAKHPDFSTGKGIPLAEALKILTPIARALDYIHEEGVFHRDVKPDNIMFVVNKQTKRMTVQLIDFGLAAQLQQSSVQTGTAQANSISGTPQYMAPEQWLGKKQCRQTDQYALGVIAYRLLSATMPFQATNVQALMAQVLTVQVLDVSEQPAYISAAILKALSKEPEQRFARCADFIRALQTGPSSSGQSVVTAAEPDDAHVMAAEGHDNAAAPAAVTPSKLAASVGGGSMTMLPHISRGPVPTPRPVSTQHGGRAQRENGKYPPNEWPRPWPWYDAREVGITGALVAIGIVLFGLLLYMLITTFVF